MHINKPARSAQFTPGPWVGYTNTDEGRHIISEAYAQDVIVCEQVHTDADISIIAAAPAMYEALETVPLPKHNEAVGEFYTRFYAWYEGQRKQALAQAEGR